MFWRSHCTWSLVSVALLFPAHRGWSQQPSAPEEGKPAKSGERVVLSVGDDKITSDDVERIIRSLPPQYRAYYGGQGKAMLPQYLVQMEILDAEARKQNLQDAPEVQKAIEIARNSILADAAKRRMEENIPVSDQQIQEAYDQQKSNLEEKRIRRILIRTSSAAIAAPAAPTRPPLAEAEARKKIEDLRKQILAGADFAELAQANSEDLMTAGAGGDMGYVNRQQIVAPVWDAANALQPGKVSDIISTPYGLELIKLEDKRVKPLSELRAALIAQIRADKFQEEFKNLATQYKVTVDTGFFTAKPQESQKKTNNP